MEKTGTVRQAAGDEGLTYELSGFSYARLDPFKKKAQAAAVQTATNMRRLGFRELTWSRGESAYLFQHESTGLIIAFVIEGLGTKNIVAENPELRRYYGQTFYAHIGRCNVAMTINDLISSGALPLAFGLHPAVEDGGHLTGGNGNDDDLIVGTMEGCNQAGCTWGPGETPGLRGIVVPGTMCLSGAGIGVINNPDHLIDPANIQPGQCMVAFASSGCHSNGYTMLRLLADRLPQGYLTDIGNGQTFGEAILVSTTIYAALIEGCQRTGVRIKYAIPVSGHGWRKIMRAPQPFTYRVKEVPPYQQVFHFVEEQGPMTKLNLYGTLNMNAGYILVLNKQDADMAMAVGKSLGINSWLIGYVEEGRRQVIIEPLDIVYDELDLR